MQLNCCWIDCSSRNKLRRMWVKICHETGTKLINDYYVLKATHHFTIECYEKIWFCPVIVKHIFEHVCHQGIGRSFFSRHSFFPRSFAKKRISFLPRSYFSKGTCVPFSFLLRSFLNIVNSRKASKEIREKIYSTEYVKKNQGV